MNAVGRFSPSIVVLLKKWVFLGVVEQWQLPGVFKIVKGPLLFCLFLVLTARARGVFPYVAWWAEGLAHGLAPNIALSMALL